MLTFGYYILDNNITICVILYSTLSYYG